MIREVWQSDSYRTADLSSLGAGEIVVDVGAHVGSFARKWYEKNPKSRIYCIEAARENMPYLRLNVGGFAQCFHGAVTYEPGPIGLLNSVIASGESTATGGSRVVPLDADGKPTIEETFGHAWRLDERPPKKLTLEDFVGRNDRIRLDVIERIDVLKLDCEGSEFSILENSPSIFEKVRLIVGEYHDRMRFNFVTAGMFHNWKRDMFSPHPTKPLGLFHLFNPRFFPQ